jgi:hypothetical protein
VAAKGRIWAEIGVLQLALLLNIDEMGKFFRLRTKKEQEIL